MTMHRWMTIALLSAALAVGCKSGGSSHGGDAHGGHAHDGGDEKHEKIAMADLPAAVRSNFEKDHPGAKVLEVEKETYADGTVHYELKYTGKDGATHETEYSAEGEELGAH